MKRKINEVVILLLLGHGKLKLMFASHQICQMYANANHDFNLHKTPKFSAPSAPILTYLYRIYAYKTSFLSFLAPQAIFLAFVHRFYQTVN